MLADDDLHLIVIVCGRESGHGLRSVAEFLADNVHVAGSINPEANRIGTNADDRDGDVVSDQDPLTRLP